MNNEGKFRKMQFYTFYNEGPHSNTKLMQPWKEGWKEERRWLHKSSPFTSWPCFGALIKWSWCRKIIDLILIPCPCFLFPSAEVPITLRSKWLYKLRSWLIHYVSYDLAYTLHSAIQNKNRRKENGKKYITCLLWPHTNPALCHSRQANEKENEKKTSNEKAHKEKTFLLTQQHPAEMQVYYGQFIVIFLSWICLFVFFFFLFVFKKWMTLAALTGTWGHNFCLNFWWKCGPHSQSLFKKPSCTLCWNWCIDMVQLVCHKLYCDIYSYTLSYVNSFCNIV